MTHLGDITVLDTDNLLDMDKITYGDAYLFNLI